MISIKQKRTKMLLVAAAGALVLSAGAVANLAPVSANADVTSFEMTAGASVRTDNKKAIRFTSNIDVNELDALVNADKEVKVVTLITATDYLDENEELKADTVWEENEQAKKVVFSAGKGNLQAIKANWNPEKSMWEQSESGSDYIFNACLYDIEDKNLTRNFSARSYIEVDGAIVKHTDYSATNNSRNIWDVAKHALENGNYENTEAENEPYDNLALLCAEYTVNVENAYTGETKAVTVKRGVKLTADDEYALVTANVDGQAYFESLTEGENAYADGIVLGDKTLKANYRSLAFTENGDGTYSVAKGTLTAGDTDTVIIPDTYKGGNVTAFASGHKFNGSQFKTIKVSNNITSIPGGAFFGCANLETVIMPSVTKTEDVNVFYQCTNLTTVVVNGEAKFSRKTFTTGTIEGYTPQVDLYIDGTENNITYWRYDDPNAEEPYEYDSQNDMLSSNVYYYAETNICGSGTWSYAQDGVTVEMRAEHNFVDGVCQYCKIFDAQGVTYGWDSEKQCYYVANNASLNKEVVEILNEYNDGTNGTKPVSYVADSAFHSNTFVTKIILPENVTVVGGSAFFGCTNLETVIMPNVLETTGTNVFCRSPKVSTVVINSNANFNRKTFYTDTANYTASLNLCIYGAENNITQSENNMIANTYLYSANGGCGTWKWNATQDGVSITVHNEREDGYCANCFAKLDATKAVTYAWDEATQTYYVSAASVTASRIYVGATFNDGQHGEKAVTYLNGAFANNKNIVEVVLPDSITSIAGSAFSGCTNLTTVVMAGVTKTEDINVFLDCTNLTAVVVNGEAEFSRKTFALRESSPQVDLYIVGTENNITYWNYGATPPVEYESGNNMLSGVEYLTGEWSYDANGLPVAIGAQA